MTREEIIELTKQNILTPDFIIITVAVLLVVLMFLSIYYLINIGNRFIEKGKRIEIDLKLILRVFLGIIVVYIIALIFKKFPILGSTVSSIALATIIAYIINPLVNYFENRGIKRPFGVLIIYGGFILLFAVLLGLVIPKTIEETTNLVAKLPGTLQSFETTFFDFVDRLSESFPWFFEDGDGSKSVYNEVYDLFKAVLLNFTNRLRNLKDFSGLKNIAGGITAFAAFIFRVFLTMIFAFYFVIDKDKIKAKVVESLPKKHKSDVLYLSERIDLALMDFLRGRILMAVFVGIFTTIALLIIRVDFAIVIGIITTIADIIPYIGPILGLIPAMLFAFIDSPIKVVWVVIIFMGSNWLENNIVGPKLLGDSVGLHPLIVLLAIVIGGGMFGVLGMILGVPFVAVAMVLFDFAKKKYIEARR